MKISRDNLFIYRDRSEHRWIKEKMKKVITKSTLTGRDEFMEKQEKTLEYQQSF